MLSGIRVLEWGDAPAWLAGRILAALGAEVVRIPETAVAAPPLDGSDVLLETFAPEARRARGLEPSRLAADHPRLVHCALTPFGGSGPHAGFRAGDLVLAAMAGCAAPAGGRGEGPPGGPAASAWLDGACEAALAALMALHAREDSGRGQHVDVSLHESRLQALRGAPARAARVGGARGGCAQPEASGAGGDRAGAPAGVYAGLRVLVLGDAGDAAGLAARYFAEQGARVVRIREPRRGGAAPGEAGAPDAVELGLDLAGEEGVALARRLAGRAEVVVAGAAPGLLAGLGLGPEQIALSCAAAAGSGPPHADVLAPRYVAALLAAALLARRRTGRGRHLAVSAVEEGVRALAALAARADGAGPPPPAPHGVYPCEGGAIAIAVRDDEEWDALVGAMGDPAWALEPRFATAAARRAHGGPLDARLAAWTAPFAPYALMAGLQQAGVPAGVVQDPAALLRDPQLAHRGHFVRVAHAQGALFVERSGFRLSATPGGFAAAGAPAGALLRDAFGLSDAEVAGLRERGALP